MLFEKNEVEKARKISYTKSLIFLTLIIIWAAKKFMGFNIVEKMRLLILDEEIVNYILIIMQIGVQFFTTLAVMAFFIMVISGIIFEIMKKYFINNKKITLFMRMKNGSESRLINSIENVMIALGVGTLFDKHFFYIYQNIDINYFEIVFLILCICMTIVEIIEGILHNFFVFRLDLDMLEENK